LNASKSDAAPPPMAAPMSAPFLPPAIAPTPAPAPAEPPMTSAVFYQFRFGSTCAAVTGRAATVLTRAGATYTGSDA
jgi:hypothetical protein